jgi:hypothetical protein
MTIPTKKEILQGLKQLFSTETPAPVEPKKTELDAKVVSYAVEDGEPVFVDISDDGIAGLDANDTVFTDEAKTTAYPDGEYTVAGTTFKFTVAGGAVTNITDESGNGCGEPVVAAEPAPVPPVPPPAPQTQNLTPEQMAALASKFATGTPEERIANLEIMCKALMEYCFGWDIRQVKEKADREAAIKVYQDELANSQAATTTLMSKQQQFNSQAVALLEQLVAEPVEPPKTLPENKKEAFNSKREERLLKFSDGIKKLKEEKK